MKTVKLYWPLMAAATFPSLALYQANMTEIWPVRLTLPLLASWLFAIVSYIIIRRFTQSSTKAAVIIAAIWTFLFFSYGFVYLELADTPITQMPLSLNGILLTIFVLVLIAAFRIITHLINPQPIHATLSLIGGVLISINLIQIVPFEINRIASLYRLQQRQSNLPTLQTTKEAIQPDIYYFVFDRYAREDVLKKYLNFDNQPFLEKLSQERFYVATQSASNYSRTFTSLAGTLNLHYLDYTTQTLGPENPDRAVLYHRLIKNNRLTRFLKSQGYRYILLGDYWDPTRTQPQADAVYNHFQNFDKFHLYLYEKSFLNTLLGITVDQQLFVGVEEIVRSSKNLEIRLVGLEKEVSRPGPKFVFGHFLLPHIPVVFSSDCQPLSFETIRRLSKTDGYLGQLKCANHVMRRITQVIKQNSNRPVVIVFQSDEGPFLPPPYFGDNEHVIPNDPNAYRIHAGILNAVYISAVQSPATPVDYSQVGFYPSMTPINTLRLILNHSFGTNLETLKDQSFVSVNTNTPYQFKEITQYTTRTTQKP